MTDNVIKYESAQKLITNSTDLLETMDKHGITGTWSAGHHTLPAFDRRQQRIQRETDFTWKFDWTELKNQGVESLAGHLIFKTNISSQPSKVYIIWKQGKETVSEMMSTQYSRYMASYELHLTPTYSKRVPHNEKMFAASERTDAILVVDGKKLHVNKAFLSFHSDFFTALFSSNFKEGQLTEIPIQDVSHGDFCLLLSTIHPKQVFPNDATAEKLLELADRFLMPSVTHIVEYHIMTHSKLSNEKSMWLADVFRMPALLEKCIQSMDTVEKAKTMKKSEEYKKMSLETIEKLFCRLLQFV